MNRITTWIKQQTIRVFSVVLIGLFLGFGLMGNLPAQALTINSSNNTNNTKPNVSSPATSAVNSELPGTLTTAPAIDATVETTPSPLDALVSKTQASFDKALTKANDAIANLSQQLEEASTATDPAIRKQIKKDLENKQDDLENAADSIDDLGEKWQKIGKKLTAASELTQGVPQTQLQQNISKAQLSFENTAKLIDDLADSTEKAKKNTTAAVRTQIDEQIKAVNQALTDATQAIQSLTQKQPA